MSKSTFFEKNSKRVVALPWFTVEALYLLGFHRNVVKNWFLRHHASVAWHDLRGQGRASGGCAWAQNVQLIKLYNLSSSTASWDPSLTSEATSWHWCMTSQKPTFDDISMQPLHPVCRGSSLNHVANFLDYRVKGSFGTPPSMAGHMV